MRRLTWPASARQILLAASGDVMSHTNAADNVAGKCLVDTARHVIGCHV